MRVLRYTGCDRTLALAVPFAHCFGNVIGNHVGSSQGYTPPDTLIHVSGRPCLASAVETERAIYIYGVPMMAELRHTP